MLGDAKLKAHANSTTSWSDAHLHWMNLWDDLLVVQIHWNDWDLMMQEDCLEAGHIDHIAEQESNHMDSIVAVPESALDHGQKQTTRSQLEKGNYI